MGSRKKDLGATALEGPPGSADLGRIVARKSSTVAFMFLQGARHSENLYLIHNKNSICRLCKLTINIFSKIPIIGS